MMHHGMGVKTINLILYHLFKEIFLDKKLSWKRAVIHDRLQADIFLHYWKKYTPDFSTFFLNSTAHFQHAYWRYMDPEIFSDKANPKDVAQYRDAILFGYRNMDRLLADFFALENNHGVMLVLATALSQQPFLKYESIGGQRFYRPRNVEALFAQFAIYPQKIQPTMTHQFMARFDSKEDAQTAFEFLSGIFCENEKVFDYDRKSATEIYFGCQLRKKIPENSTIDFGLNNRQPLPFYDNFYMIDQTKSGLHHPDGILWIKTGKAEVYARKVSILDIFPTIISITKVDYQASQGHPFRGRSLHCPNTGKRSESMSLLSRH